MSTKQEAPVVVNGAMRDALVRAALDRVESQKPGDLKTAAKIARSAQRGLGQTKRRSMWSVQR